MYESRGRTTYKITMYIIVVNIVRLNTGTIARGEKAVRVIGVRGRIEPIRPSARIVTINIRGPASTLRDLPAVVLQRITVNVDARSRLCSGARRGTGSGRRTVCL